MAKKSNTVVIAPAASMVLLMFIAGCPQGTTVPNDNGSAPAGGVSFKDDVEPILTPVCGTCHTAGGLADERSIALRLDDSDGFAGLFNDFSIQDGSLRFVVAGDPDSSLVYLKISTDNPPVGSRMPLSSPPLSQAQQDLIRTWIAEGAKDN